MQSVPFPPPSSSRGSTLVLTLLTASIIGVVLASYLLLVGFQHRATARSMAWNSCVPIMESGVEEALTQINRYGINNLPATGWAWHTDGLYHKTRAVGPEGSYYDVGIQNSSPPVIFSSGYVRAPLTWTTGSYVSRRVRVDTRAKGLFNYAMLAKGNITFSGSARTDSFDSTDPNYSTSGKYDPTKARDNGDVASNGTVTKTFTGSSTVSLYGHLATGPGGTYSLSGGASVGDTAWHLAGNKGVETGWFRDDMNVEIPDVDIPFTSGYYTPGGGTVAGTNYVYVIGAGNNKLSQFVLSSSQKAIVTGDAVLYVTDKFTMSGSSSIIITPGSRLQIYNGAQSGTLSGSGVANQTGSAAAFMYWGLPTNTKVDLSGSTGFIGVIYAPEADFTMSGGSSSGLVEFTGASVSKTVTMSGGRNFHYDESLARLYGRQFVVAAWNEL